MGRELSQDNPDPEMLKYLDVMVDYDALENADQWDDLEKMEQIKDVQDPEGS